jgi:hypothetical protein
MSSKITYALIGLSFAILTVAGGPGLADTSADPFADCVRDAASEALAAKTEFQTDLRDLIVSQRPDFEALATVNMELQILFAEARRAKFDYLLKSDRGRIDTANGLGKFSNFPWTDEDTALFKEDSAAYRDVESRLATLRKRNNSQPDWPQMREYFRSDLSQSADFAAVMAGFQGRQKDVETAIAQCRR